MRRKSLREALRGNPLVNKCASTGQFLLVKPKDDLFPMFIKENQRKAEAAGNRHLTTPNRKAPHSFIQAGPPAWYVH